MAVKTDQELAAFAARLKEASLHMILHISIWAIGIYALLSVVQADAVYIALGVTSLVTFVFLITKDLSGQQLIIRSWIGLACAMTYGAMIGRFLYIQIMLPLLTYICLLDIFSFTRYGKTTANAKVMSSNKWLPRLLVYGRSFQTKEPVATKGFGDYYWYSVAFATIYTRYGKTIGLYAIMAIILGVVVDLMIIRRIYKYTWYKGFPMTVGPLGLCLVLVAVISIIS